MKLTTFKIEIEIKSKTEQEVKNWLANSLYDLNTKTDMIPISFQINKES